jgi:hypothetical protein
MHASRKVEQYGHRTCVVCGMHLGETGQNANIGAMTSSFEYEEKNTMMSNETCNDVL